MSLQHMLPPTTGSDWGTDSCTVHDLTGHSPVRQCPCECRTSLAAQGHCLLQVHWCCPLVARGGLAPLTSSCEVWGPPRGHPATPPGAWGPAAYPRPCWRLQVSYPSAPAASRAGPRAQGCQRSSGELCVHSSPMERAGHFPGHFSLSPKARISILHESRNGVAGALGTCPCTGLEGVRAVLSDLSLLSLGNQDGDGTRDGQGPASDRSPALCWHFLPLVPPAPHWPLPLRAEFVVAEGLPLLMVELPS